MKLSEPDPALDSTMLRFGILTIGVGLAQAAICVLLRAYAALFATAIPIGVGVAAIISSREKPRRPTA